MRFNGWYVFTIFSTICAGMLMFLPWDADIDDLTKAVWLFAFLFYFVLVLWTYTMGQIWDLKKEMRGCRRDTKETE